MISHFWIITVMTAKRSGRGILNSIINKLPVELHIPTYQYCGPGTKLEERLARGDKPINKLDAACMQHDIAYSKSKDLKDRHEADKILGEAAWNRTKSWDAGLGERATALFVSGAMKAKRSLGMGLKRTKRTKTKKKQKLSSFAATVRKARTALKNSPKSITLDDAVRIASTAVRGVRTKAPRNRIIPVPKRGGVLPLVPIFAGLSALGLAGKAKSISQAINNYRKAQNQLKESKTDNVAVGKGVYLRPYKQGMGLYLKPSCNNSKN